MTTYSAPLDDIKFLLNNVLEMPSISKLPGFEDATPDMVDAILNEAARFYGEVLAPTNKLADSQGSRLDGDRVVTAPALDGIYKQIVNAGWPGLTGSRDFGGQGLPMLLSVAVDEMSQSANMAFSLCPMLTKGVVTALNIYGSSDQKKMYLSNLISGAWSGTMNLTEPQAGSDLSAVKTKATLNGDHYLLSGQKIYITWGDHDFTDNIIHLVLARTPGAPEGVKGISLFIVPKFLINDNGEAGERNDVRCVGIEHKLGIHASPTCTLSFGEKDGAIGYLIGDENQGLVYMFAMMNEARLAVGLQGISVSERAYQQAVYFAKERVQGSTPDNKNTTIIHHPDVRRMLMTMRALIESGRALTYSAFMHEDYMHKSDNKERKTYHQRRIDLLTPLVKGWCTENSVEITSLGLQIHGGMGFIEETGAAQHMRDARILPIYEGTNGIQALDLVGRKLSRDKGKAAIELLEDLSLIVRDSRVAKLEVLANSLEASLAACKEAITILLTEGKQDWTIPCASAFNVMMLMGGTAAGAMLAKSAIVASNLNDKSSGNAIFNKNKILTAIFYAEQVMPRNTAYLEAIRAGSKSIMALDVKYF
ncbi:MAG: acyl-CoA dehydrogenase [Porticoccus sp.]|jgi:alkylation response protein AidB-like acyl-CoA dehydrogenase|uniref:acyl-CoA dehydrogenase n=1 Tax=Porticoccus sp. Uisw_050_02 TaxID=3230978 RepID=UPI00309D5558|tara:strand:- start:577 stop:2352 length:1776 start_codon:yes stop_codon:yes gene_type:complete